MDEFLPDDRLEEIRKYVRKTANTRYSSKPWAAPARIREMVADLLTEVDRLRELVDNLEGRPTL